MHESFLLPTSVEDYFSLTNDSTGEMVNNNKKRKPKKKLEDKMKAAMERKRKKYELKEPCSCKKQCRQK